MPLTITKKEMRLRCNCQQRQRVCSICKQGATSIAFKSAVPGHQRRLVSQAQCQADAGAVSRRDLFILTSGLVLPELIARSARAEDSNPFGRGLSKYVRKKKLEPIETYIPTVLEARQQLEEAGGVMVQDMESARQLLREGPFQGLRDNVRALGEYAVVNGQAPKDSKLAEGFLRALESYDSLLFQTIRSGDSLPETKARERLGAALSALDNIVATVPDDMLQNAKSLLATLEANRKRVVPSEISPDVESTLELLS